MSKPSFVYVTYIKTSQEKLWQALTDPEFNRQYWFGAYLVSEWKKGASWKILFADGRTADSGEILEIDPPRRMVIKWRHELTPELKAEGHTRCTIEIEPQGDVMRLSIRHETDKEGPSKFIGAVSEGWPHILASLKSLLETGKALPGNGQAAGGVGIRTQ